MRISDWSSDVCSSDLPIRVIGRVWCKDLDGGGSIWLLGDIEHPATGIGLLYPPLPDALDTLGPRPAAAFVPPGRSREILDFHADRKSVVWGKSVSVRVDPGGRGVYKKKKKNKT